MKCPYRQNRNQKQDSSFKNVVVTTESTSFGECYKEECPFYEEVDNKGICLRGRAKIVEQDK